MNKPHYKDFSLSAQLAAVDRELGQRRRVYPRLIADGKMSEAFADYQIKIMEQVWATINSVMDELAAEQRSLAREMDTLPR